MALAMVLACVGRPAMADNGQPITRIEEDWKIEFGSPDPDTNAPQVIMTIPPSATLAGPHAIFEVNHRTQPNYSAGGLQLQRWNGDEMVEYKSSHKVNVLAADNDLARFTMSMEVQNGALTFGVSNGSSGTWGTFGNNGHLSASTSCDLSNLASYDPDASLANSRVGFASYRVQKVTRTQVRHYSGSVLISTDSTEHVIHHYDQGD
jgi:hypothetical protein